MIASKTFSSRPGKNGQRTARLVTALVAGMLLSPATMAAKAETRPLMPIWGAQEISKRCDGVLAAASKRVGAMEKVKGPGKVLVEWNALLIEMEDVLGPAYLLSAVHPDKAARDAGDACVMKLTEFGTALNQNEKLYLRVKALKPADAVDAKMQRDLLDAFEDAGVTLPPEQRKRAKEILDKLENLRQTFDRNVRDDKTTVTVTAAEMAGMPEAYVKAQKQDDKGNYVLGLNYPAVVPFLANAANEAARERVWRAKQSEGGMANIALLDEIMALRLELAKLYGLKSYGEYSIRRKMAESPANVLRFLADVKGAVRAVEEKEIADLRADKAALNQTPLEQTRINRWDVSFHQERLKKARFSVDQEALRKNFPTPASVAFALKVSERLYGVTFKKVKVPVWHADVEYYDVLDAKTGKFISGFYLDLFPREGKYGHAAAFPIRGVSRLTGRTPQTALVTNFDRVGLTHSEFETLMHEFGHVLHGVLSTARYNAQAGTNTLIDFVEAPSQMFEEWTRRPETLALFKDVCAQCPPLSEEQIKRIDDARRFGKGIQYARQWLFASYDMALVGEKPESALAAWKRLEGDTPLGHVDGSLFPAAFSHIAGGYGAGYYGYMWSQVMALDMLSGFKGNLMDPAAGKRYRDAILARGGEAHPAKLVRDFLGREPNSQAFFAEITGKR